MNRVWSRLRLSFHAILFRRRLEDDMAAEFRFHLESRTDDLIREGFTPREASRRARLEFGGIATHQDQVRATLGLRWLDELSADLLYALRILKKSPGFTAIAVASLALAIGANTTIFSYANQMLYVRLGAPHPTQLRMFILSGDDHSAVHSTWGNSGPSDDGRYHFNSFSYPIFQQLRGDSHATQEIFAFKQINSVNVTANGVARVAQAELVSGNFFPQMQLQPQLGRLLQPSDDAAPGAGTVAVISDAFWHTAFGGATDVLGKTISVNMTPFTIVGVNSAAFTSPDGASSSSPELFVPLAMINVLNPMNGEKDVLTSKTLFWVQLMARAQPGVSDARAIAALNVAFAAAARATMAIAKDETIPLVELEDGSRGDPSNMRPLVQPLHILLGLAGLVLMLACANIANLMLARASARQREMSVRMALGAGRSRILRQVLTESLLVAFLGGVAGLFLGYLSRNLIPWLTTHDWDGSRAAISFDWRVFGFTAGATLLTGILFGVFPAWLATHAEVNSALKEGSRTATKRRKAWSGKIIVGFQVALSTLLVIAAVFFLRTLVNLNRISPGFRAENLLLFSINPPATRYPSPQEVALHHRLEDTIAALPGVQSVTLANVPLIANSSWNSGFLIEGVRDPDFNKRGGSNFVANLDYVGPTFFSTLSIPILSGRAFTAQDTETSVPVSVINQALARKFFPGVNPIGKRFRMGDKGPAAQWKEIIGVAADTQYNEMRSPPPPIHFDLYRQMPEVDGSTYIVRSPMPPAALLPVIRRAIQQVDPDLPMSQIRTQQQQIAASMQQERLFASLTTGFGVLALALACVGIYGIMAYTVAQRTNEIGIRLALGAVRNQIRAMVLRETGWLALSGVIIGVGTSLALIRLVKSMLYGLKPGDPLTLAASTLLLLLMAFIAGWVPAHRASHVEPIEALRHD